MFKRQRVHEKYVLINIELGVNGLDGRIEGLKIIQRKLELKD